MKKIQQFVVAGVLTGLLSVSAAANAETTAVEETAGMEALEESWASAKHSLRDIYETNRRIVKGAIQVWSFQGSVKMDSFYNSIKDGAYNQFFEEKGSKIAGKYTLNHTEEIMEGSESFLKKTLPGTVKLGENSYDGELLVQAQGEGISPSRKIVLLHSQEMNLEAQLAGQEMLQEGTALERASYKFWETYPKLHNVAKGKLRIGGVGALVGGLTSLYFARRDYYEGEKNFEEAAAEVVYVVIKDGIVCYAGAIATDAAMVATGMAAAGGAPVIVTSLVAGGLISMAINHAIDETDLKEAVDYLVAQNL